MPFEERFAILIESGQANAQSVAGTRTALEMVEQHYGIQLGERVGAALATHLAITVKRLLDGDTLLKVPDVVWEELDGYPEELSLAAAIVARLEKELGIPISRDELGFIAVHLGTIRLELGQDMGQELAP